MVRRFSRPRICSSRYVLCLSDASARRPLSPLNSLNCDRTLSSCLSIRCRARRQSLASRARIKARTKAPSERSCSMVCACKSAALSVKIAAHATRTACFTRRHSIARTLAVLMPPLRPLVSSWWQPWGIFAIGRIESTIFLRLNGSYSPIRAQSRQAVNHPIAAVRERVQKLRLASLRCLSIGALRASIAIPVTGC